MDLSSSQEETIQLSADPNEPNFHPTCYPLQEQKDENLLEYYQDCMVGGPTLKIKIRDN